MKKIFTILPVLATLTTPAFAQSFCTCDGTGNVLTFSHNPITSPNSVSAATMPGLQAYASVPGGGNVANPNAPVETGGGSLGYNQMLRNY
ncbi:MAG TPA: hypothetical protein VEJ43_09395 [Pseudolabrys sp.]|nr:hypothetical protein [Pseudolabrys sp.]